MTIVVISILFASILTYYSSAHGLGLWLVMMICHGIIVSYLGDIGVHLPFYVGLAILVILGSKKELKNINYELLGMTILLLCLMAISSLTGLSQVKSLIYVSLYAKGIFLALVIAATIADVKSVKLMSIYCLVGLLIGALYTVYQHKTGNYSIDGYYLKRAAGLREDPNDTAMLLLAGLPIAVYWFYSLDKVAVKIIPLISIALLLVGIALTNSRGGFVTLVFVGMVLYLKRPNLKNSALVVIMVIGIVALAPQSYWDRMDSLVTGKEQHGGKSLSNRLELLKKGGLIFMNNPIFGVGPGNFGQALQHAYTKAGGASASLQDRAGSSNAAAHNMYLEYFAENGFVAGLLFLFILFKALINYYKFDRFRKSNGINEAYGLGFSLSMAILAMLFASLFLSQGKNSVLWFLIGVGYSAACIKKSYTADRKNVTTSVVENSSSYTGVRLK